MKRRMVLNHSKNDRSSNHQVALDLVGQMTEEDSIVATAIDIVSSLHDLTTLPAFVQAPLI